jgi:hypothetical protein
MVQHDESVTNYDAMVNQMTQGHRFIASTFGPNHLPRVGWQIDPFGSSAFTPYLFSLMGFEATVVGRVPLRNEFSDFKFAPLTFF